MQHLFYAGARSLPLIVLGLSGALTHDPSAALYIDGELVAAAEEERFTRNKHAKNAMPLHAARFCMRHADIKPVSVSPAPYMTITFEVSAAWRERIPEVIHEDGTSRVQVVNQQTNPRYHALLKEVETLTGHGAVLNTSMNRRGEPMVCSPTDALNMFFGSDLEFLFLEDLLVTRQQPDDAPGTREPA